MQTSLHCLLTAILLCASVASARAETFFLKSGESFEGTVIRSIGNTLSVTLAGRGMRQFPIKSVDRVDVTLASGERVTGELVGWSDGAYQLRADDELLSVRNGQVIKTIAVSREADNESFGAGGAGGQEIAVASPDERVDSVSPSDISPPKQENGPVPVLSGSAAPIGEGDGEAIIQLSLSSGADHPIVVIYSVLDQSAEADADYTLKAGVLTISAGTKNAAIHVPIIDDEQTEPDEEFKLFLSVDPNMAQIDSRDIIVTIQDDDS